MENRKAKCLVWDLDNTLWKGVLLEDEEVKLRSGAEDIVHALDRRGILQSIASRNDFSQAMTRLQEAGLSEFFIYPQISWNAKSTSLKAIAREINIGMDAIAFIDDEPFEREEVASVYPEVLCLDAADLDVLLDHPALNPAFITEDSRHRRKMYQADMVRRKVEEEFSGAKEEFLATLGMKMTIAPAEESDLARAEELTVRTHQLNTTGYTYSYQELDAFMNSDRHRLWIAGLEDKFGSYGKIGLALVETVEDTWWIRLLLMSCRVMNRGVGSVFINYIRNEAREAGVRLMAEMIPNDRNRVMYMTYKFNHFRESSISPDRVLFENDLTRMQAYPEYLELDLG